MPHIQPFEDDTKQTGRKRALSPTSAKSENKKANLGQTGDGGSFSATKQDIESRQERFFMHYRSSFEPLLPKFFNKLMAESILDHQKISPRVELRDQPSSLKSGSLKHYQLQGLSFLLWMHNNGTNCILGDEMGLGKTLQTLSLFAHLKETEGYSFPNLVICPLSVLPSWLSECTKWFPSFVVMKIHGPLAERAYQKQGFHDRIVDIVVTTYDAYFVEDSWFKSKHWSYCVLDEGHKIKDSTTFIARKVQGLGSLYRLILTGTPIQNNLTELWSLLHWLYPSVFVDSTKQIFAAAFNLNRGNCDIPFLEHIKKTLQIIMLRRTKEVVERAVPPLDEMVVFLPLTEAQRFWYLRLLRRLDTLTLNDIFQCKIEDDDDGRKEVAGLVKKALSENQQGQQKFKQLMNLLMQLRRICDHPYIVKGSFPEPYEIGEHIVASSSKFQFIDKLLKDLIPKKERILCFSQWTDMLDMLEDYMALRGVAYARLDGSVPRARRTLDIKLFQQEESPYQVFLLSTHAGGLGINLTKATHVILCDCTWNPQIDRQSIARCHRIGQTREVKVYRLICQDSVEDQMLDRLRKKLLLSCKVMADSAESNEENDKNAMGMRELVNILRRGTSALARWEANSSDRGLSAFLSASLEEILARSKKTENLRDYKVKHEANEITDNETLAAELELEEQKLLSNITAVRTRFFEGQWHKKDEKGLSNEWSDIQKRNRSERLVMHNGIESLPYESAYASSREILPRGKQKKADWEHEDTCLDCWDGGDLLCCDMCPRVYHVDCRGMKPAGRNGQTLCSQHKCFCCGRNATAAGGMLFRCRSCPSAFCEDCMPEGDIDAVGPTLPELISLGYGEVSQAYWIYCESCRTNRHSKQWQQDWEERLRMNLQS